MAAGIDPPEGTRISRNYIDGLPYASILAWFDGSPQSLLVLGEYETGGRLVWRSAERQSIATEGPFVVQAMGTELELRSSKFVPAVRDLRDADGVKSDRSFDVWAEGERVQFTARSRFRAGGIDEVDLLGQKRRLRRFVETVTASGKPRHRNDYWIDEADGFCWKSRQIVVPRMPHLNIEVMKRASPPS